MGALSSALIPSTRIALSTAIVATADAFTQQGLSNSFWALATIGLKWHRLDRYAPITAALTAATVRLSSQLTAQSEAAILHALSKMDCQYATLSPPIKTALLTGFTRLADDMTGDEVSVALYGLGRMGAEFASLPFPCRAAVLRAVEATCDQMGERELGNTVWALVGQLGCVPAALPVVTQEKLFASVEKKRFALRKQSLIAILQVGDWQQLAGRVIASD
jgi:hypothetical protein